MTFNQGNAQVVASPHTEVSVEPESPVVEKLITRATSLPVTIHKFFSVSAAKGSHVDDFRVEGHHNQENQIATTCTALTSKPEEVKHHSLPVGTSFNVSATHSVERKRARFTDRNTEGQKMMTIAHAFQRGAKRRSDSVVMDGCTANESSSMTVAQCPVCQKMLKLSASNVDLNRHLDDCLKRKLNV